jgi:4-amino-4-deoxy-L-arabinose transferase-like glycosyltransferase
MNDSRRELGIALALVALLAATSFVRPIFPVDETRYVGVAWEMWQRGDFLVPYQNGVPYSHKPPLYFWLMHAGWALFGVNECWPRSCSGNTSWAQSCST